MKRQQGVADLIVILALTGAVLAVGFLLGQSYEENQTTRPAAESSEGPRTG